MQTGEYILRRQPYENTGGGRGVPISRGGLTLKLAVSAMWLERNHSQRGILELEERVVAYLPLQVHLVIVHDDAS